jgi:hypothetical protein
LEEEHRDGWNPYGVLAEIPVVDDVGWIETNQGGSPRLKPEQVRNWIVGLKPHASTETRIGDLGLNRDGAKYPTPAEGRLEWATQR